LERFQRWLKERAGSTWAATKPTLIFDKGNDSADNFALIDTLELPYVGSVKLDEHPDLAKVSNQDARWQPAAEPGLEGTKSWRTQQGVYGQKRTLVMTYNQNLYDSQWAAVQNDLAQALSQLAYVQRNLQDRAAGLIRGGTPPTVESVERKCEQVLHRQHLRQLVQTTVTLNWAAVPQLSYQADPAAQEKLKDTHLGKTLLITGHKQWSDAQVIRAYRSQFVIEEIFHEMKDRHIGAWWPLHHWTDSKIQVHGLYCTIAVLLRALLWRRARQAGLRLSMSGLLEKLGQLRQVINVYPTKRADQPGPEQAVLTKRDETQDKLIQILGLPAPKSVV
jgi:transposase